MTANINFAPESEAHYSLYSVLADREVVVVLKVQSSPMLVMIIGADDEGITVCPYNDGLSDRAASWHVEYGNIENVTII